MLPRGFKTWCENTALEIRRHLKLEKVDPLPAEDLAEYLGVWLCAPRSIPGLSSETLRLLLGSERDCWSALTISRDDQYLLIYNSAHSSGRRSNDIMHELAHILLGHDPARVMFFPDGRIALRTYDRDQEDEASWLAGCLLLPRECLVHIMISKMGEVAATDRYHVSPKLLRFRLDKTGVHTQFRHRRRLHAPGS